MSSSDDQRSLGLLGATGVGVGAIVGGGILVLVGAAFATTGPGAIVAFAANGVIALITALSFAELSCSFPQSGGAYTFAKKILSVRAAFGVGWVLWFAYITAGALYALGFAVYAVEAARRLLPADWSGWLGLPTTIKIAAALATAFYAAGLIRRATGGGQWATVGKVVLFVGLIVAGIWASLRQPIEQSRQALTPFFSAGPSGLLAAMGTTFIALQGFDLIPAVGGEVKDPRRVIPRAMFLSLGLALVLYLPLLLVVTVAGVGPGESITTLAEGQPDTVMAVAAGRFLGSSGYWVVVLAALLSTLSALQANLLAASRVALSMARDRTLPAPLGRLHPRRRTPALSVYTSALTLVAILFVLPDLAAAGSAASLIFLISFTLVHWTAFLARRRGGLSPGTFRSPAFPLIPVAGALLCGALALFQAFAVPAAGGLSLIWLGLGVLLYLSLFAGRAETADAAAEAQDPNLLRLRGRRPLVLLPIANPAHAAALMTVANALAPREVGRVLLLTILPPPGSVEDSELSRRFADAEVVVRRALTTSFASRRTPQALITTSDDPRRTIREAAREHRCESLLLGLAQLSSATSTVALEDLVNDVDCDVAILRAVAGWRLESARRVLVPVGGRGEQHGLRARLLASLERDSARRVTFLRVVPLSTGQRELDAARQEVEEMAAEHYRGEHRISAVRSDRAVEEVLSAAARHDLLILGLRRHGGRVSFGEITQRIVDEAPCAAMLLSRKGRGRSRSPLAAIEPPP